jgi:hypothetical protein
MTLYRRSGERRVTTTITDGTWLKILASVQSWETLQCQEHTDPSPPSTDGARFQTADEQEGMRARQIGWKETARDLEGDDDLTDLSVRLHIAVGFDDFSERKCLIDHRLESTGSKMVEDILFRFREYWIEC